MGKIFSLEKMSSNYPNPPEKKEIEFEGVIINNDSYLHIRIIPIKVEALLQRVGTLLASQQRSAVESLLTRMGPPYVRSLVVTIIRYLAPCFTLWLSSDLNLRG